ncbi:FAD synthetase family protein [Paraburkholderia sp. UYCP14C]|uniref:FAD synthetase family protein n=1 Tax=Paraburkholderia sp. UYCP14C TaxID=2511130 RepID=UPI0010226AEC|nr:FAD synthetase family protein [Paraburkholderia sp. UYCP14C]RZF30395.1 FAD synthetase family protein [Paraburkholderia sp. UYCP14C]
MIVISDPGAFRLSTSVVSVGMFDGVHHGHRHVLGKLRERGLASQLPTVVVTFDPHPLATLRPASCPAFLSTLEGRMSLLASTGRVDYCVVLRFDRTRSEESADEFVEQTLVRMLGMRSLVVGENFTCGRGRQGDTDYLGKLGARLGFDVFPVPLQRNASIASGAHCSSSETRRLIQRGDIVAANAMLSRPHELSGTVYGLMKTPWRAIDVTVPADMCLPPAGDYAGTVKKRDVVTPSIGAILQVREQQPERDGHAVRVLVDGTTEIAVGDAMTVQFLDRAKVFANCAAIATTVDLR